VLRYDGRVSYFVKISKIAGQREKLNWAIVRNLCEWWEKELIWPTFSLRESGNEMDTILNGEKYNY
jgi:hypothetical protein